ncbi:Glycine--tRNA ligase 1, mitochondrial [Emydomyces testavorans]|uniref:glycine--tRNA ligase n=1 Tax=Emydomyces testavorans TaxID=2070801 RepID=A0AAF0IHN3_9EURO|nr:Glycine--tRNA ligase 1, mitochondrial [Emydomyces testavorans]
MSETVTDHTGQPFNRPAFESLLKRRFFFTESFEIYRTASGFKGDNRGLFDYGPPGCALQANIVDLWRKHFVLEEDMLELDCTALTPEDVFKTSGHVDKFADWMCKDPVKGEYLRADHLVESVLKARLDSDRMGRGTKFDHPDGTCSCEDVKKTKVKDINPVKLSDSSIKEYEEILAQIDNYDGEALGQLIKRLDIRNPDGNNEVLPPIPFNLMFRSTIGPSAAAPVYLRPETAQGQFLNFRKLLEYNNNIMPFASASVGKSYRNEISPRSGLLRVREFLLAEIEHFVDPRSGKKHDRFDEVQHLELPFLDQSTQLAGQTTTKHLSLGRAVEEKVVNNETLGYFLGRTYQFFLKIGVDKSKLRFRQHLAKEMAHYACDCWDAELLTTYGWIECVGCADRSAYDLTVHAKRTGEHLVVKESLPEPISIERWEALLDRKKLGPKFRKDAKVVESAVSALNQDALEILSSVLETDGQVTIETSGPSEGDGSVTISKDILSIKRISRVQNTREYTPNVIEPSFGIGRILYSLLEHVYWSRPQAVARGVLSLPPSVAPTKVLLVPLSSNQCFRPVIKTLSHRLRVLGIPYRVDNSSASIGKRYARNDELGTPFGITVDFDTVKDDSITLRERDTMQQVRAPMEDILAAVKNLVDGVESWEQVSKRLPEFASQGQEIEE